MQSWLKKILPSKKSLQNNRVLKLFGAVIHKPNLWRLSRSSVAKATAIGLFTAFIPLPIQMFIAAGLAIFFSANIPLAIALVWLSNPLTMPAIFYFCYLVGAKILATQLPVGNNNINMANYLYVMYKPLLLGCFISGVIAAILGYIAAYILASMYLKVKTKKKVKP